MKLLALNATYRPNQTTTRLTEKALEGAASLGLETEMVHLKELNIGYCTNCLTCYKDLESEIAPCVVDDDMRSVLEKIRDADGVILASPVHSGFVTGLMTAFLERATWTLVRPTGEILGLKGCPEPRLTGKIRASASILSAGGLPPELRAYCDRGTPWLREMAELLFNGEFVGDVYAGAVFNKELADDEWSKAYFYRELTEAQFAECFELGRHMARKLIDGEVQSYDPLRSLPQMDEGGGGSPA